MPLTRAARKRLARGKNPVGPTSKIFVDLDPSPPITNLRDRITPQIREKLLKCWDSETLEWMLDNEKLTLGNLIETGINLIEMGIDPPEDDVDWAALEQSSDEENLTFDGPRDIYGVAMDTCGVCRKLDLETRLPSCSHCGKRAHVSCLRWIAREDPRKPGHYQWYCPPPPRTKFLEWYHH